jgi:hypothetical protein
MVALAGTPLSFEMWHMRGERTDLEFGTPGEHVKRQSQRNPTRARVATRLSAMHVWSRSITLLRYSRCVQESPQTAHAWQSQTDSDRDMDFVREQVIKGYRTTRVKRTHPDTRPCQEEKERRARTKVHWKGRRQSMVCGGYTRGKRFAVPHKV